MTIHASPVNFDNIARLPLPGDNVAIATRDLRAGEHVSRGDEIFTIDYDVLEGHRFALRSIPAGAALRSWELPFGEATIDIAPGNYVCNASTLHALRERSVRLSLPDAPNFADHIIPFALDEASFHPAEQVARLPADQRRTFSGYRRDVHKGEGKRGVGTRNHIVLLGLTSRAGGYVRALADRLHGVDIGHANVDGIVAAAHTEGDYARLNNRELLLRTLAGWITHPNVGAVLVADAHGTLTADELRDFMRTHNYPLDSVLHRFLPLDGSFVDNLDAGAAIVRAWLPQVNAMRRTDESIAHLKIALQCGGSDAFSGVSGNPLAGAVARAVIQQGGAANLAETDELIGAESYVLQHVRDLETARKFLATVERFKTYAARHGSSAEGNPSGGNKFRGLYNIVLKSIGAAMKKPPNVRLDHVIDYGEPMDGPGYYFMDSPGNDLESIAGQIAAGCNLIFFVTGNGSITNFPFVPTLKFVTTTRRYELLEREMDVNAGAYLDGVDMETLTQQTLDQTLDAASGQRTVGERAGHAQVQIWRNWQRAGEQGSEGAREQGSRGAGKGNVSSFSGRGLRVEPPSDGLVERAPLLSTFETAEGFASERVGLVLPTSLCAGQIALLAARRLNRALDEGRRDGALGGVSRYVALAHTEGCGASSGASEALYARTLIGYLRHPLVARCLLLEHGCEKTHNDYVRHELAAQGVDLSPYGWASVQLDGGIAPVLDKIEAWFAEAGSGENRSRTSTGWGALRLGLLSDSPSDRPIDSTAASSLATIARLVAGQGGTVVLPEGDALLAALEVADHASTLDYGQRTTTPGLHVMHAPTAHAVETLTGLGATGVELVLALVSERAVPAHPLVPVLQVAAGSAVDVADVDLSLAGSVDEQVAQLTALVARAVAGEAQPRGLAQGNVDFQITRGAVGISL